MTRFGTARTHGARSHSSRTHRLATGVAITTCIAIGFGLAQPAAADAATTARATVAASDRATTTTGSGGTTGTVASSALTVTSPGYGTSVDDPEVTVTGLGAPGDRIAFADDRGRASAFPDASVGADGTWTTTATFADGDRVFAVGTSAATGATALVSFDVRVGGSTALTVDPTASRNAQGDFVLTGRGTPGNVVELGARSGSLTGSALVGGDGRWSITVDAGTSDGFHAGEVAERNGATVVAVGFYGVHLIG